MNKWEQAYPTNVATLLKTSKTIADSLCTDLQFPETSRLLGDLFGISDQGKCERKKDRFLECWAPNLKEDIKSASGEKNEFRGLYVFVEEIKEGWKPVYVGISRTVYRRLRQHGWYENPSSCTFAYLRCKGELSPEGKAELRKSSKKRDPVMYKRANDMVEAHRVWLRYCRVVLNPVQNHFDLYFHEVAMAGMLKTEWNSFRTH